MHSPFSTYGRIARVSTATAQAVRQGSGGTLRVSYATMQVVLQQLAAYLYVARATVQVVHRGEGTVQSSFATMQVIWTTGAIDGTRQRAWTFDFDGHTFYVLDLPAPNGTLVFDLTTGQWSKFTTSGYDVWNFKNGFHWRDGKMVTGGTDGGATLLQMTPDSFLDEDWRPVQYELRGLLTTGGVDFRRQYALRLIGSAGVTADDLDPVLHMQFSDDNGQTWSAEYDFTLSASYTRQRIEFRSLGAFTAPGRIFRLYDTGGIRFLAYVEADIGGENERLPS